VDEDQGESFWGKKRQVQTLQGSGFRKAGRLEIGALGGVIPNDPFFFYSSTGLRLTWYVTDSLAIGGVLVKPFGARTDLGDRLFEHYEPVIDSRTNLRQELFYYLNVLEWTPVYGKMSFYGLGTIHMDMGINAGFGLLHTQAEKIDFRGTETAVGEADRKILFAAGGGIRFFLNDWFAVRADVSQYFFPKPDALGGLSHPTMVSLGLSAFVPSVGGGS